MKMSMDRVLFRNTLMLVLLWCLVMTNVGIVQDMDTNRNATTFEAVQSDEELEGPILIHISDMIADGVSFTTKPASFILDLFVEIWDPNGIDTAIASYKNSTETAWTNVTLDYRGVLRNQSFSYQGHLYTNMTVYMFACNTTTFVLTPENSSVIWNVRYYARNVLGRWAVSDVCNYTYVVMTFLPSSTDTSLITQIVAATLVVGGIVMAVTVLYLRRPY